PPPTSTLFPYNDALPISTLHRIAQGERRRDAQHLARGQPRVEREQRDAGKRAGDPQREAGRQVELEHAPRQQLADRRGAERGEQDRKSTRLNSSHLVISY